MQGMLQQSAYIYTYIYTSYATAAFIHIQVTLLQRIRSMYIVHTQVTLQQNVYIYTSYTTAAHMHICTYKLRCHQQRTYLKVEIELRCRSVHVCIQLLGSMTAQCTVSWKVCIPKVRNTHVTTDHDHDVTWFPDFFSLSYMPQALFVIYIRAICCITCCMLYHMCCII